MREALLHDVAVILAAGRGRRLGDSHAGPKALLDFDGRTLLQRHIANLAAAHVETVSITVGYEADALRAAVQSMAPGLKVGFVDNPRFERGSLVSLWVQRERLCEGRPVILMDADVLCDARMISRLGQGRGEGVLLVDREIEAGDEPVKACFRKGPDGRDTLVDFRKRPEHAHDWRGESVGFFRFGPELARELAARCDTYVAAGRLDVEYEEAIRDLILAAPDRFDAVDVSDLPWTEIDFEDDVARARARILPQLEG